MAMAAPADLAEIRRERDALIVVLSGEWRLGNSTPRFEPLIKAALATDTACSGVEPARSVKVDASTLGDWDSSVLIFLRQAETYCAARKLEFVADGLPDRMTSILALARVVPDRGVDQEEPIHPPVARVGLAGVAAWDATVAAVTFTGDVAVRGASVLLGRGRMRWRQFWVVVQSNSSGALPIVTTIALLIGVIVAFLGVVVLKRFGAGYYVSYLVGYGMLREMGALMTGIIIAGRTGAGFAAELGSMTITEEIDALRTLGISPVDHLVLPRVLGLFVMMPLLVLYADVIGIAGGMGVAVTMLDLTPTQFINGLLTAVEFNDTLLGLFKASVYGAIIGMAGCMRGLQAGSDSGAVGRATQSAVVLGITLIIAANAVIDWLAALLQI